MALSFLKALQSSASARESSLILLLVTMSHIMPMSRLMPNWGYLEARFSQVLFFCLMGALSHRQCPHRDCGSISPANTAHYDGHHCWLGNPIADTKRKPLHVDIHGFRAGDRLSAPNQFTEDIGFSSKFSPYKAFCAYKHSHTGWAVHFHTIV